jgi:hypothetical protein
MEYMIDQPGLFWGSPRNSIQCIHFIMQDIYRVPGILSLIRCYKMHSIIHVFASGQAGARK